MKAKSTADDTPSPSTASAIEHRSQRQPPTLNRRSFFNVESQVRAAVIEEQAPEGDAVSAALAVRCMHTRMRPCNCDLNAPFRLRIQLFYCPFCGVASVHTHTQKNEIDSNKKCTGPILCKAWSSSMMFEVARARMACARACSTMKEKHNSSAHTSRTPKSLGISAIGDKTARKAQA